MTTAELDDGVPRIAVKVSGDALGDKNADCVVDGKILERLVEVLTKLNQEGVQAVVIVGGGNIARGRDLLAQGITQDAGDPVGMLATVQNAIMLGDVFEQRRQPVRVMTSVVMNDVAEPFNRKRGIRHMQKGRIVIIGGGIGKPKHSSDFAAAQMASELKCDRLIMAKNGVDAVYDKDPNRFPDAHAIESITCRQFLSQGLEVCDATAITFCQTNKLQVQIVGIDDPWNILRAAQGDDIGTFINPH